MSSFADIAAIQWRDEDIAKLRKQVRALTAENERLLKVEAEFKTYIPYLYVHGMLPAAPARPVADSPTGERQ